MVYSPTENEEVRRPELLLRQRMFERWHFDAAMKKMNVILEWIKGNIFLLGTGEYQCLRNKYMKTI